MSLTVEPQKQEVNPEFVETILIMKWPITRVVNFHGHYPVGFELFNLKEAIAVQGDQELQAVGLDLLLVISNLILLSYPPVCCPTGESQLESVGGDPTFLLVTMDKCQVLGGNRCK